ncbi:MAG TPA: polymer-forming cytoskeletal protein [Steroidobacteraceae bacterium]|jgi:cytoskeletal protein CcmA (bactofilin family)
MNEPKRRFFDLHTAPPTVIGAASVIIGDVRGEGEYVVSGEVHGDGELGGGLNLAATGVWNGHIQALEAIIAGKITGGLAVKGKLEIGYTAVIRGSVSARTIAIAKGAIVDGDIVVTSGMPMQEFEEKRRHDT